MMRRGLWQQKQNRPAACLLCRFTHAHGPYTRTTTTTTAATTPPRALSTSIPTSIATPSTRWYPARQGWTPCGGPIPLLVLADPQHGGFSLSQRRLFGDMPSWASEELPSAATSAPQLLPHEREARERAAAARAARLATQAAQAAQAAAEPACPANPAQQQSRAAGAVSQAARPAPPPFIPVGRSAAPPIPIRRTAGPIVPPPRAAGAVVRPGNPARPIGEGPGAAGGFFRFGSAPGPITQPPRPAGAMYRPGSLAGAVTQPPRPAGAVFRPGSPAEPISRGPSSAAGGFFSLRRPPGPITQPPRPSEPVPQPAATPSPASAPAVQASPAPTPAAQPTPAPAPAPKHTPPPPEEEPEPAWAPAAPAWASATPAWAATPDAAAPDAAAPDQAAAVQQPDPLAHLLPHEREARERAAKARAERERAAAESAERERAAAEAAERARVAVAEALERERVAAQRAEQERAAAERAAKERAERERIAAENVARERAERERAAAESASARPLVVQQADPLAYLLPHERVARERAIKAKAEKERAAMAQATQLGQSTLSRPFALPSQSSPVHRPSPSALRQPPNPSSSALGNFSAPAREAPQFDPFAPSDGRSTRQFRDFQEVKPTQQWPPPPEFEDELAQQGATRFASRLPRMAADDGEWKNLARRDRTTLPGSTFSQPASRLAGNPGLTGGLGDGEDVWSRLEKAAEMKGAEEKSRHATADASTWGWADEHNNNRAPSEDPFATPKPRPEDPIPTPEPRTPQAPVREIRHSRPDRYRREDLDDRPARGNKGRDKAKKSKVRRRDNEDDDWDDWDYQEKLRWKREKELERQKYLDDAAPTPILLPEFISVSNLADALGQKIDVFIQQLEGLGFEDVGKENILTGETAGLIAQEYGFDPKVDAGEEEDLKPAPPPADPSSLPLRPPVVTIMGHVDHGKTTLLDFLRKSSIVSQEHGGITQHIGAFSVSLSSGKQITFLDTPGHAAFLSMRQRGANVTDMVILVVAADDSVMPQTLEAIKHARAAKVPIIVAINKVDKPEANVERVKSDLANNGVEIEDYGGDVQVVCVSGKTGQGMDDLEENILLLAEMLDIRAETGGLAEGWVLESTIKPIGRVATVLVKRGTLRPGDFIVAGRVHTKIRSLRNEAGIEIPCAPPGTAVEILGWKEPPEAGDQMLQAPDESAAKTAVHYRREQKDRGEVIGQMAAQEVERRERERERERDKIIEKGTNPNARNKRNKGRAPTPGPDAATLAAAIAEAEAAAAAASAPGTITVPFVIKGDVRGSVEAVTAAVLEQGNSEVRAKVLVSSPGMINESDVELAQVAGGVIVNFNNPVPSGIKRMATDAGVKIIDHNVIYHLVEEVRGKMEDALPPLVVKKVVGEAEVLQIFPIKVKRKVYKNIAGCRMTNGYVKRGTRARVIRGREELFEGTIETLRHVKKEVDEMKKGSECGMSFADWDELQAGDQIQFIEVVQEKRKL